MSWMTRTDRQQTGADQDPVYPTSAPTLEKFLPPLESPLGRTLP